MKWGKRRRGGEGRGGEGEGKMNTIIDWISC